MASQDLPSLFLYENAYPSDKEEMVDKLPALCKAAQMLLEPLLDKAIEEPGAEARVSQKKSGYETKEAFDDDPEGMQRMRAERITGRYSCTQLTFQLDGGLFGIESYDNGLDSGFSMESTYYVPPENHEGRLYESLNNKAQIQTSAGFAISGKKNFHEINVYGILTTEPNIHRPDPDILYYAYWIAHNSRRQITDELGGPPRIRPDKTPSEHQARILAEYGMMGLVYDQSLQHLRLMQAIVGPSRIPPAPKSNSN